MAEGKRGKELTAATFLPCTDIISKINKIQDEKRKATDEELLELQ